MAFQRRSVWQWSSDTNMAVRLFEERDHAEAYLKYRVTPNEVLHRIMTDVEKRVGCDERLNMFVAYSSGAGLKFTVLDR